MGSERWKTICMEHSFEDKGDRYQKKYVTYLGDFIISVSPQYISVYSDTHVTRRIETSPSELNKILGRMRNIIIK